MMGRRLDYISTKFERTKASLQKNTSKVQKTMVAVQNKHRNIVHYLTTRREEGSLDSVDDRDIFVEQTPQKNRYNLNVERRRTIINTTCFSLIYCNRYNGCRKYP